MSMRPFVKAMRIANPAARANLYSTLQYLRDEPPLDGLALVFADLEGFGYDAAKAERHIGTSLADEREAQAITAVWRALGDVLDREFGGEDEPDRKIIDDELRECCVQMMALMDENARAKPPAFQPGRMAAAERPSDPPSNWINWPWVVIVTLLCMLLAFLVLRSCEDPFAKYPQYQQAPYR